MSLRLWKKLRVYKHPRLSRFKRLQPSIGASLTKKQKKLFRLNKKMYSGILNRPLSKYKLMQQSKGLSAQYIPSLLHYPRKTYIQSPSVVVNSQEIYKSTVVETKDLYISALYKRAFTRNTLKKTKIKAYKNNWFFRNPSAVPGLLKIRRLKYLHKSKRIFNKNLSTWLCRIRQRVLLYICKESLYNPTNSYWRMTSSLERFMPLLILKSGLDYNIAYAKQHIQHSFFSVNGHTKKKVWRSAVPGDFIASNDSCTFKAASLLKGNQLHSKMLKKY